MSAKALNVNQHNILHDYYPDNCCRAEERIRALEEELQCLKERVDNEKVQDMEPVVRTCQWWANV